MNQNKKKRPIKIPILALVGYFVVATFLFSGSAAAKYVSAVDEPNDSARVAHFDVRMVDGQADAAAAGVTVAALPGSEEYDAGKGVIFMDQIVPVVIANGQTKNLPINKGEELYCLKIVNNSEVYCNIKVTVMDTYNLTSGANPQPTPMTNVTLSLDNSSYVSSETGVQFVLQQNESKLVYMLVKEVNISTFFEQQLQVFLDAAQLD